MKGKKLLTLVSTAMGVAIVGATFAGWAVTDNADPFGIKISPGQIGGEDTKFVTLSYGDSTFANVDNLKAGEPRLAGSIKLKADVLDSSSFPGQLDLELIDETPAKEEGIAMLIDYLTVDVYDEEIPVVGGIAQVEGKTPIGTIPVEESLETSIAIIVASGTPKPIWTVVTLDADVDAKILEEIKSDVVYLEMDWNISSEAPIATTSKLYLNYGTAGKDIRCYAWGQNSKNAEYPGIPMTDMGEGYYSYDLSESFDNVIFTEYADDEEVYKSDDLAIGDDQRSTKPCYRVNGKVWEEKPEVGVLTKDFYVTSTTKGNWKPNETYGMTEASEQEYQYILSGVTFAAEEAFKVCSKNRTIWYTCASTWEDCGFTIDASGNMVVTTAGKYDVKLYTEGENGNYVVITPVAA